MPKSGIHGSIKPRVYLASDTFGGYCPPQQPRRPLDRADRLLGALKRDIEAVAAPMVGKGSLDADAQRQLSWCRRIEEARECLVEACHAKNAG